MKHDSAKALSDGIGLLRQGIDILQRGPLEHYLAELMLAHELLVTGKYAPFQVGQFVTITTVIDFVHKHPGWAQLAGALGEGSSHVIEDVRVDTVRNDLSLLLRVAGPTVFTTIWMPASYVVNSNQRYLRRECTKTGQQAVR